MTKNVSIDHRALARARLHAFGCAVAIVLLVALILVALILPAGASAAINPRINFQGRLADTAGIGVPDGTYNVEFKLHNDAALAGGAQGACTGSCLWMETRTGAARVTVTRGLFSVQLGEVASLAAFNFDQDPLYLSVRVGGTAAVPAWDGEMTPRHRLGAAPQAIHADNAAKLGGQAPSYYSNAGNLTGTVADARLSANVALRDVNNNFSVGQTVTGTVAATDLTCADCLNAADVALGAIGTSEIADGTVSLADLAANSVDSSKIVDGSITSADLANGSVTTSKLATLPAATVGRSTDFSVGSNRFTIPFDTEEEDTNAMHDNVTNSSRLTAPINGRYLLTANVTWASNQTGYRHMDLFLNGTTEVARDSRPPAPVGAATDQGVTRVIRLLAGDFVEVRVDQSSGSALAISASTVGLTTPRFTMAYLSP